MALTQGLIDSYWRKYNQRRALTGLPSSYQEQRGTLDPMMEGVANKDIAEARLRYENSLRQQQLDMQKDAIGKQDRAAMVSGVSNVGMLGASTYLGYKALQKPTVADYLMKQQAGQNAAANQAVWNTGYPNATAPVANQAAGAGSAGEGLLTGIGSGTGGSAAYTGATGTAGYGMAEGAGEAGILGAEGAGGGSMLGAAGTAAAYAGAGFLGSDLIDRYSPIGGAKEKSIAGQVSKGAGIGAAAGSVIPGLGTVVGGLVGAGVGLVIGFAEDVTVICSELLRQKKITERERTACVVFRFRHIPDDMFHAYLEWAEPIVRLMRTSRIANFFLLPFAMHFVGYMLSVQAKVKPTITERLVWKYAWSRCEYIAHRQASGVKAVA